MRIPAMVDMRRTPAEKEEKAAEMQPTAATIPDYPWGLSICLTQEELAKLNLDDDVEAGDLLHLHALAKVTSVSKTDNETLGPQCRVELTITHMVAEDEDEENEEEDRPSPAKTLYR